MFLGRPAYFHTTDTFVYEPCMYELERLAQDLFFEVLDQFGDSIGIGRLIKR